MKLIFSNILKYNMGLLCQIPLFLIHGITVNTWMEFDHPGEVSPEKD